jgi:polysaccharide export outer membrane protein
MPLIGEIALAGKTVAEAEEVLQERYAPHLRNTSVSIQVRSYASQKVYVGGEVIRPGTIPLVGDLTVVDAVMEAGGVKLTGSFTRVVLIRKQQTGSPVAMELTLLDDDKPTEDALTPLEPYDVVLIPETKIARIDRWVDQHIRQLIPLSLSAGFTYLWNSTGIVIDPP